MSELGRMDDGAGDWPNVQAFEFPLLSERVDRDANLSAIDPREAPEEESIGVDVGASLEGFGDLAVLFAEEGAPLRAVLEIGSDPNAVGAALGETVERGLITLGCDPFSAWVFGEVVEVCFDAWTQDMVQEADHHRAAAMSPGSLLLDLLNVGLADEAQPWAARLDLFRDRSVDQVRESADRMIAELGACRAIVDDVAAGQGDNTSFTGLAEDREWARMRSALQRERRRRTAAAAKDRRPRDPRDFPSR